MSVHETYKIAHTARCKLQLAADRPDRNLRFILGHAFTLDKLRLRIAEIEVSGSSDSDSEAEDDGLENPTCSGYGAPARPSDTAGIGANGRRVSFQTGKSDVRSEKDRRRSPPPPPPQPPMLEEDTESEEDDIEEDDEEEGDLGLVRFGSAAAQPPRILDEEDVVGEANRGEEIEVTDPKNYSEEELKKLCEGKSSEELRDAYFGVAGCPCHGKHLDGPKVENFWELPQADGAVGPRLAIMQVA
ncbi:uncharacterized protein RCO7_09796 [Rhynchosporium graminicola]|uniref:Uncharacterized protein n=1 Tax=Rhynchosporium graminicola TaxID=2792576 RepID=A0A1E1LSD8_9HELO|nr:uncharacterized protein RCO7_09796 [Rhynchosporium commune]